MQSQTICGASDLAKDPTVCVPVLKHTCSEYFPYFLH